MNGSVENQNCTQLKYAFVIMPFAKEYTSMYRSVFMPALIDAGFAVTRGDEHHSVFQITHDIERSLIDADLVLCYLNGSNPNVYYELGLAHALGKHVILVAGKDEKIPFDISHIRIIIYDSTQKTWQKKLKGDITSTARNVDLQQVCSHLSLITCMVHRDVVSQIKGVVCLFKTTVGIFSKAGSKFRLHFLEYNLHHEKLKMKIQDKVYPDHNFEISIATGLNQNIVICEALHKQRLIHKDLPDGHATFYDKDSTIPETLSSVMAAPVISKQGHPLGVVSLDSKVKFSELGIDLDDLSELFLELCCIIKSILDPEV
jgi:nucleoside 2-deoxyribosyltransferase